VAVGILCVVIPALAVAVVANGYTSLLLEAFTPLAGPKPVAMLVLWLIAVILMQACRLSWGAYRTAPETSGEGKDRRRVTSIVAFALGSFGCLVLIALLAFTA
jgi:hypothetical protein